MKDRTNILTWLGMKEEYEVLKDAEKHIDETCKTVAHLAEAVKALVAGDVSAKSVAIENVRQSEREADKLLANMIKALSEGLLMPTDREDLLKFVSSLDEIADWTNSAARLMWFLDKKLPEEILKQMSISSELIVEAIAKLRQAIHAMSHADTKTVLSFCDDVEGLEHQADDQKRHMIGAILEADLTPPYLLVCYNLGESLEGITDKIAAVADIIGLLTVKSK